MCATSASPTGGAATIAFFDVAKINGKHTIVIPDTQFSYNDILKTIAETPAYQKLVLKNGAFTAPPSPASIKAGFQFLQMLWQCFTIEGKGQKAASPFGDRKGLVVRSSTLQNIQWKENRQTRIFDSCHFSQVDFSGQCVQDDFIFCTFENCRFAGATLPPEGVQGRFPFLRCTFLNCEDIPKDTVFQNGVKNCRIVYR